MSGRFDAGLDHCASALTRNESVQLLWALHQPLLVLASALYLMNYDVKISCDAELEPRAIKTGHVDPGQGIVFNSICR